MTRDVSTVTIEYVVDGLLISYDAPRSRDGWELTDAVMPESVLHDEATEVLKALLSVWAARVGDTMVARNLAIRWDPRRPQMGADPDLCVLSPIPPEGRGLTSLCTWLPDHAPPRLAVEIVSHTNPHKDYYVAQEKYGGCAVEELWVFDPLLIGPNFAGGPRRLQLWRWGDNGAFRRIYVGDGPVFSPLIGGYLVVVDDGRKLRITADAEATQFWLTREEQERAAKEDERAAKDRALARVAELEAQLADRDRDPDDT